MKNLKVVALSLFVAAFGFNVQAQKNKTVVENAIDSKDHTV